MGGLVREQAPGRQGPARDRLAVKLPFALKANGAQDGENNFSNWAGPRVAGAQGWGWGGVPGRGNSKYTGRWDSDYLKVDSKRKGKRAPSPSAGDLRDLPRVPLRGTPGLLWAEDAARYPCHVSF